MPRRLMDPLIVVTYPDTVELEAKPIDHDSVPEDGLAVGYYLDDALIARSVVARESMDAIHNILSFPVSLALAATEDEQGNIDGRVCLILPIEAGEASLEAEEEDEPWKASVPEPPPEIEQGYDDGYAGAEDEDDEERMVLLPIGNVVRPAHDRHHPDDAADDAREMLENLLTGKARDAVAKAIDDLLDSI